MITVRLPLSARRYTGGIATIELSCSTVAGCLTELLERYPDIAELLKDAEGRLRSSVKMYVNGEDIWYRSNLDTPLQDGDELVIMMPIAGGSTLEQLLKADR